MELSVQIDSSAGSVRCAGAVERRQAQVARVHSHLYARPQPAETKSASFVLPGEAAAKVETAPLQSSGDSADIEKPKVRHRRISFMKPNEVAELVVSKERGWKNKAWSGSIENLNAIQHEDTMMGKFSWWKENALMFFSRPFFGFTIVGFGIVAMQWLNKYSGKQLAFQLALWLLVMLPSILLFVTSFVSPGFYHATWEWGIGYIVAAVSVVLSLLILTQDACKDISRDSWDCYTTTEPMIVCVYFFAPFIFGAGQFQGIVGNIVALAIMLITIPLGDFEDVDYPKMIVITILSFCASFVGIKRAAYFSKMSTLILATQEREREKLDKRLRSVKQVQQAVALRRDPSFRPGQEEPHTHEEIVDHIQNTLNLAMSVDVDKRIREKAWSGLLGWIGAVDDTRKVSQAYYARETSLQATHIDKKLKQQHLASSPKAIARGREKMKIIAGISMIRQWMARVTNHFSDQGKKFVVFLGGSCNPTTWRKDTAIPRLQREHIAFYNPQVDEWTPDLVQIEAQAKEEAAVLFFVIDKHTNALASMMEVVELSVAGRQVVLVIEQISAGTKIGGHVVSKIMLKDLNRSRAYTRDVARRFGVPVYDNIEDGLAQVAYIKRKWVREEKKSERRAKSAFG